MICCYVFHSPLNPIFFLIVYTFTTSLSDEKPRFEYRRMIVGDHDDGVFVEKYEKHNREKTKPVEKKRDLLDFVPYKHIKAMSGKRSSEVDSDVKTTTEKRSIGESSASFVPVQKKKQSSGDERRSVAKRSLVEEGSTAFERKRRKRRSAEGSGTNMRKRRSNEGSSFAKRSAEGSGMNLRKRRSVEGSGTNMRKRRSNEGSGFAKRSAEGSGMNLRKRRSIEGSGFVKRSVEGSGMNSLKRRSIEGSGANLRKQRSVESSGMIPPLKKKRSVETGSDGQMRKREVSMADLPDGAVKMAARSGDVNDIEASLKALEYLAKRDEVPKGKNPILLFLKFGFSL